jgi:hypothetical protein
MYPYENLNVERSAIRLLILHPSDWDSPITCAIQYALLDENPIF